MTTSIVHLTNCLDFMRDLPDKAFSLAVVDPEYGQQREGGTGKYGRLKFVGNTKQWDADVPNALYFQELFRISENQIIFGGNYFALPPTRGFAIWDKGAGFRDRDFAECEMAWTSFDRNAKVFSYDPLAHGDYHNGKKIHPTQKPVALYKWLFQNYAKPGDTIFDSHVGSGSSRIAAYDLGFDLVGCELDPDYWQAAEERFARHCAQPKLFFAPTPVVEIQTDLF